MEEQLKQYLTEFVELLKQGGQFALDQMPAFIHEYLTYYAYYHGFWALLWLVFAGIVWYLFFRARYLGKKKDDWDEDAAFAGFAVSALVSAPLIISSFYNFFDFLKVVVAPRLYLIENLLELIK